MSMMKRTVSFLAAFLVLVLDSRGRTLAAVPSRKVCGLTGFDVDTLYEADYWTLRVPDKQDCLLPIGHNENTIEACNILVSVCKPLGESVCPGSPNSTTCQQVITKDFGDNFYDMGGYQGNSEFVPLDSSGTTGFASTRVADYETESGDCNGTITTNLIFVCDPDSKWNSNTTNNVTQHIALVQQFFLSPCQYLVQLHYDGACYLAPTLPPSHCSIEGYDTGTISSREYWTASVADTYGCYDQNVVGCMIYLAFCHPLPLDLGVDCYNAAVCQKEFYGNGTSKEISLGSFTNFIHFYSNDEKDGFHMRVENGSKPENGTVCKNGMMSEVILTCDKNAPWDNQDISEYLLLAYHHGDDPCMYVLKIAYSGACVDDPGESDGVLNLSDSALLRFIIGVPVGGGVLLLILVAIVVAVMVVIFKGRRRRVSVSVNDHSSVQYSSTELLIATTPDHDEVPDNDKSAREAQENVYEKIRDKDVSPCDSECLNKSHDTKY